jgi:putative ABC transport system permease protein
MTAIRRLILRLVSFFRRDRADADLAREIASHLQLLEDRYVAQGMSQPDARLAARRTLGSVDRIAESQRDARSFRWLDDARMDVSYSVRSLLATPAFTAAAVLTLSLGIAAATTIYSVADAVLLRPLPFPDADRLVSISENGMQRGMPRTTYQEYLEWRARTKTISGLAAVTLDPQLMISTPSGTARVTAGLVSGNYFEVLGVRAALGRTLVRADEANPAVAVLSFDTWERYFGRDPRAIGSQLEAPSGTMASRPLTVVGVLPEDMEQFGTPLDLYAPVRVASGGQSIGLGRIFGRMRDGVSLSAASQEANVIGSALRPPRPASAPPLTSPRFEARDLKDGVVASLTPALRVFIAAVAVVLMIVCANVANLVLARGTARGRQIAVRLALGASRGRIVRQVLTDSVVLALAGGALGAALASAGVSLVKQLATTEAQGVFRIVFGATILPRANEVRVSVRVFEIAFALAAMTSMVFGLLPALHLSRTNHLQAMGSRGGGTGRRETRIRTALVVAQLALATTLLIGAGLLSNSFVRLATISKGYDPDKVLAFQLVLPDEYPTSRKAESIEAVLARVRSLPAVATAGFAYAGIFVGIENTVGSFVPPGSTLDAVRSGPDRPRLKSLSPGYLESVGAQVLAGRLLSEADARSATPAIVINRTVAQRYFGQQNPVGTYMDWHGGRLPVPVQVVGVVEDIRQASLERQPYAEIFMDYRQVLVVQARWGVPKRVLDQLAFGFMSFAARTRDDPRKGITSVRQAIAAADPNAGIDAIAPMERLVAGSVARQRFYAVTLGTFAAVAALLAAIGVYGVLAYAVVQRTREIGIRVALGAGRSQVLMLVLRRGVLLALIGVAIGLTGAIGATRYLQGMLFGITPLDRSTFAVVSLAFLAVAALASYLPARRATEVDPMVALRSE